MTFRSRSALWPFRTYCGVAFRVSCVNHADLTFTLHVGS